MEEGSASRRGLKSYFLHRETIVLMQFRNVKKKGQSLNAIQARPRQLILQKSRDFLQSSFLHKPLNNLRQPVPMKCFGDEVTSNSLVAAD